MKKSVQVAERRDKEQILSFLQKEGQLLLPLLELVETSQVALDQVIDVTGRALIELLLQLSAERLAGPKQQGVKGGEIRWHGSQGGVVHLRERKVRVAKPRLRRRGLGRGTEVPIPAYEAMQDYDIGQRMLDILLRGVSTRKYEQVLPKMAETVGIKKSSVSRNMIQASEKALARFSERRWDDVDVLIIYLDGVHVGDYHVIVALGVDTGGRKHVLGMKEGSTENAVVAKGLLQDLVERGVNPERRRLFVVDGSKALRKALVEVFGGDNPVQRCRLHKERNVLGYLPDEQKDQTRWVLRAAWKLDAKAGMKKLEEHARWLEKKYPAAAASLREGLEEMFTINRLGLSASLRRCLGSTNIIENPNSAMRNRTRNVKRWKDGAMVLRWLAAAFLDAERCFKRIQGYNDLWMLEAALRDPLEKEDARMRKVG